VELILANSASLPPVGDAPQERFRLKTIAQWTAQESIAGVVVLVAAAIALHHWFPVSKRRQAELCHVRL
jgi:hypothetical protein